MIHSKFTEIYVLKDVPLNNLYRDSIVFNNTVEQTAYFSSKVKNINGKQLYFDKNSYQRVFSNKLRVPVVADDIYDCNYIMFKNYSYNSVRFYYAFITQINYLNEETSEIIYELDVLQTWMFDYELEQCMIERQHAEHDAIGNNLAPEPVEISEYVLQNYKVLKDMKALAVIIAITDVQDGAKGTMYGHVYGGSTLYAYNVKDIAGINAKLNEYKAKPDSVTSMYCIPAVFIPNIPDNHVLTYGATANILTMSDTQLSDNDTFNGFRPRNKKLYTYPYNFYHIDNGSGMELNLRYEFFGNLTPTFKAYSCLTQPVQVLAFPTNYKGSGADNEFMSESIALTNYPLCSWNNDAYQAWIAQNSIPMALTSLASGVGTGFAISGGNPIGAGVGLLGGLANMASNVYKASIAADITKGSQNNGNVNIANENQNFRGGRCTVTQDCAQRIDNFFTKYGYAIGKIRKPNIKARPHYTYIKTAGAVITGSVPANHMSKICSIFDSGITWWLNGDEIGNYLINNNPV